MIQQESIMLKSTKKEEKQRLHRLFMDIWNKRPRISEVSKQSLGTEPLTIFFHHILPKNKYPQAMYDPENIILLTFREHDNVEINMYRYEEINKRREQLKIKYNL